MATPQDDIFSFFDFANATDPTPLLSAETIEVKPLLDLELSWLELTGLDRSQLLQRFYDLYFGTSISQKRMFDYEVLGTNDHTKIATNAAIETL